MTGRSGEPTGSLSPIKDTKRPSTERVSRPGDVGMPVEYAYVATSVGFCAGRLMANVPLDGNCRNCTRLPAVVRSSMYIRTDDVMPSGPSGVEPSPTRETSRL